LQYFIANDDATNIAQTTFEKPILARYLRIEPIFSSNGIAMRIEVYGCFEPYGKKKTLSI
jgi:hypothetical protein